MERDVRNKERKLLPPVARMYMSSLIGRCWGRDGEGAEVGGQEEAKELRVTSSLQCLVCIQKRKQ